MKQVLLGGQTGVRVSAFALGTGRLGLDRDGTARPDEGRRVLASFADAGGSFIDTSSAYQHGEAKAQVGAFLAEAGRDKFVVASKYGRTALFGPATLQVGSHRGAMRTEIEGSLKRLGTDRIDLYFPHFDDGLTPMEEIMAGLNDLVQAGKVVHVGFTNFPAWRIASGSMLAELRGLAPVAAPQLEYSLLERTAEREHLPLARARGMGVMAYSPLTGGRLPARLRVRSEAPGGIDIVADTLLGITGELGCATETIALAWVRAKGLIPIVGARDSDQLAASLAANAIDLSEVHVQQLDAVSKPTLGQPYDLLTQVRGDLGLTFGRTGSVL